MDPLGATASVFTLVDASVSTLRAIDRLLRRYQNVPEEIIELKHRLNGLNSQLVLIKHVQAVLSTPEVLLIGSGLVYLEQFLQHTSMLFQAIRHYLEEHIPKTGTCARLKWALQDAQRVREWEHKLRSHAGDLSNIMILLNFRLSSILQSDLQDLRRSAKEREVPSLAIPPTIRRRGFWALGTFDTDWIIPSIAKFDGSISCSEENRQTIYGISLRFQVLFSLKTFCFDLEVRHLSLLHMSISTHSGGFKVKHTVPEDAEIMTACNRGDVARVWHILQERGGSVNDITPKNSTPLRYAIESGSVELVSLLTSHGADVNANFGQYQTSPLDWALATRHLSVSRFLLSRGAEVYHINAKGWTPIFNIFGQAGVDKVLPSKEYIEMLSAVSFADLDLQDGEGWSCVHRAAAYGTADDIATLKRMHASISLRTQCLLWTPIFCAVQFGNVATFLELANCQPSIWTARDVRGWTLLHVAVNAKHAEIVRLLIQGGADPHVQSAATKFFVPEDLKGLSVTPGDIARRRGSDDFFAYINALKETGYKFELVENEINDLPDVFWPALS